tara:strand:- start:672 stop:935 length:264 start_codon:yes stop_codon:yes gene_type:complete
MSKDKNEDSNITGLQIRMARAALRLRVDDLSKITGVSWARIQQIERNDSKTEGINEKLKIIKENFEKRGIIFNNEDANLKEHILIKK